MASTRPLSLSEKEHEALAELSPGFRCSTRSSAVGRGGFPWAARFRRAARLPDRNIPHFPLSELEMSLVLCVTGGTTGWHFGITRHPRYAPALPNYSGAAGGKTFPSAAGFHTSELFYTDDSGIYFMPTRDAGASLTRRASR